MQMQMHRLDRLSDLSIPIQFFLQQLTFPDFTLLKVAASFLIIVCVSE